ncbi:hypothetical protein ISN44_As01g017280 [Arabidopsis suecica]|uniref:Transmembrane protein n=1 Tax=Arabidopsis suecica TaxID=45249 RepID=A0A8T2H334_ARASU|nr:hypothetical protein ISN44_As01g017280 [Arabidopsis suecica]
MLSGLGLILSLNCKRHRSFREEEEDRSERASERLEEEMMEEGPPAPKMLRMVYFVGAGFLCTFAINKWREMERNSLLKQEQEKNQQGDVGLLPRDSVQKAMK